MNALAEPLTLSGPATAPETTVLVVDDSALSRRLACVLIERRDGWNVEEASDGHEAMDRIARHRPSAVVTDMMMPGMDGLALVEAIRSEYPSIPVVLMTAHGNEDLAVRALHAGAASYVPKRHLPEDLVPVLERVLSSAAVEQRRGRLLGCLTRSEFSYRLDNDPALVPDLVATVQEKLTGMSLGDGTDRIRIGVALGEAVSNAMFHGNLEVGSELREGDDSRYFSLAARRRREAPYRDRRVDFTARITRSDIVFDIRDEGPGFNPSILSDPEDPANLERVSGRGLLLIRAFMDEVDFSPTGSGLRMVKRFSSPRC